jgi:orotate phosphoribosyltransferase
MTQILSERKARASEILFEIDAIQCRPDEPFIFTSGWASPVYVNCRKIISMTWHRREIIQLLGEMIESNIGVGTFDVVAGGETAGIPYAAWMAEYFYKPMIYVRKKPKGFGQNKLIEGDIDAGSKVVIVEDLMTDGKSKVHFADALRAEDHFVDWSVVVFSYGVYPATADNLAGAGLKSCALTDWKTTLDVAENRGVFSAAEVSQVREYLADPPGWSKAHGGVDQ